MFLRFSGLFGYTTNRLIVMIFVAQIVTTGAILYYVHEASERALVAEQRAFVGEIHDNLLVQFRSGGLAGLSYEIEKRLKLGRNRDIVILLTFADGKTVVGNLVAWPAVSTGNSDWLIRDLQRVGDDQPEPIGMTTTLLPDGSHLLTGHVLTGEERLGRINRTAIISAFLLALPAALLIAILLARLVGRRIKLITNVTEQVREGDLSRRIPLDGTDGAFDELSEGVNAMLERLENLVSELRMVTDGLAHDLRSPITRLKSLIEHAIVDTKDETALTALGKVSAEADTLLTMLTTALQISRAEAGIGKDRFAEISISELLADLVEIYGPLAEDYGFEISSEAPETMSVSLHRELVSQALGNLIENALKYAKGGNQIVLGARREGDLITLSVADNGEGIATERQAEARKRFGRLDPSRQIAGSGLGFSLVEAAAKLHGGTIELKQNYPGLRVDIIVPR
jgi:signal transduction histidine kinase